jgi:hypothetical protein
LVRTGLELSEALPDELDHQVCDGRPTAYWGGNKTEQRVNFEVVHFYRLELSRPT